MANLFSEKPIVKVVMLKGQDGEEKLINQADGSGLSFWIGTQAEYNAIPEAELVEDCIYYITDDTREDYETRLDELDAKVDTNTTNITDNTTDIAANTSALDKLIFKTGDNGWIKWYGGGYLTSSKSKIAFSVPLPKYLPTGKTISIYGPDAEDTSAIVSVRQNGNYLIGNADGDDMWSYTFAGNHVTIVVYNNALHISLAYDNSFSGFGDAVNNDTVGIHFELKYVIS